MTTNADYTQLITSEHIHRPNFVALVGGYVGFPVDSRNLLQAMPGYFDVDAAVGVQLDKAGQWVGVTRVVTVQPSDAYPAPAAYQTSLDDLTFRLLIKARALANRWDGTAGGTAAILAAFYGPLGAQAAIVDNQDMSIDLYLTGTPVTAAQAAVFSQMIIPLRPMGVRIRNTYVPPPPGGPLFGLDYQNNFIAGPDFGAFGNGF